MLKSLVISFLLSSVIGVSTDTAVSVEKIPVTVNEYVELMEVVARLAGNSIYTQELAPAYQKNIEESFGQYREHPCVKELAVLEKEHMIWYNAIPMLGANIEMENGQFRLIGPEAASNRWPEEASAKFLPLLSDFYNVTGFHSFFKAHKEVYDRAVKSFEENVMSQFDVQWYADFFGAQPQEKFIVIIGLNNGVGNFNVERSPAGGDNEHVAVMMYAADENSVPCYNQNAQSALSVLIHEFCHSFIKADRSMMEVGIRLLQENTEKLHSMGYGTWYEVIEETFVRAATIRYLIDHGCPEDVIQNEINQQGDYYGMVWMPKDIASYRGDIFKLFDSIKNDIHTVSAGRISMTVDAANGAKILSFCYDGKDIMSQMKFFNAYGSTFWTSPQTDWNWPPIAEFDRLSYTVEEKENSLVMTGRVSPQMGFRVIKEFSTDGETVVVNYSIVNESDHGKKAAPWEITRVPGEGLIFFDAPLETIVPPTTTTFTGKMPFFSKYGISWFEVDNIDKHRKVNADGHGWLAYLNDGLLLVKEFEDIQASEAAPAEAEIQVYVNAGKTFIELESQGRYVFLQPGGKLTYKVRWHLMPFSDGTSPSKKLIKAVKSAL